MGSGAFFTRPVTTMVLSVGTVPQNLTICLLSLSLAAMTAWTVLRFWRRFRKASFADWLRAFSTQQRKVISLSTWSATSSRLTRAMPVGLYSFEPVRGSSPYESLEISSASAASFFVRSASSRAFAAAFFSACTDNQREVQSREHATNKYLLLLLLSLLQGILGGCLALWGFGRCCSCRSSRSVT